MNERHYVILMSFRAQQQQQQPMQQILQQNFGLQSWTAAPQYQQYGQPTAADAGREATNVRVTGSGM